jgi:hypothetical protein
VEPVSHLNERVIGMYPCWPRLLIPHRPARQVREHLAALLVKAQRPWSAIESPLVEMLEQGMNRGSPRAGRTADGAIDKHRATRVSASQSSFHKYILPVPDAGHGLHAA